MDDEGGVKASVPVTRLRRRLSVEQSEEVKSSPAANTPTKKRGGRRAAKPELDLIDENAPDNNNTSKRTTRKAAVKELEEVEEKPLTPSRRSARIRSNTSIVSETTQTFDSPRAKRVARRASQVGSDNEAVLTPVRQTRRTRKDSTSNVENAEPLTVKPMKGIIVEEEAESSRKIQKSPVKSIEQNHSPSGSRKSPRLSLKKNKNSNQTESNDSAVIHIETTGSEDHNSSNKENETETPALIKENHSISDVSNVGKNNLSESSSELLQKLKTEPDKITSTLNKSTSAITDKLGFKSKRHRTKSWTTLSAPHTLNDNIMCFSDSESIKKKRKSKLDNSSDTLLENSPKTQKNNSSFKKIKKSLHNDSANKLQLDLLNTSNQIGKEEIPAHPESSTNAEAVTTLFEKEPSTVLKTTIFIEETDSNSEKNNKNADDDQCVPEVEHYFKEESKNDLQVNLNCSKDIQEKTMSDNKNNSCEPMDIDETIPDNVSLSKPETSVNKDSKNKDQVMECSISQGSKKRKSSLTTSNSEVLEKSCNENKSTLVLSQLKDISNDNHVLQSSDILTEKKSKYDSALDTTQDDNGLERKNSLSAYSTSTPLNQKGLMKLAMKINTSDMTSNNTSKIEKSNSEVNKKKSNISNTSSEESESEEESEQEKSKFIDDEAEEASCDYESGDSKDEEQEQYERENEIVQKGETLTSEDELSNDSDYEKDSFIVSSDEEDDELLDGSGDDLSMSDNELKMTKESKQKYNERKLKEQKKASREMFESRHKLNMSKESNKSESLNKKKKRAVIDSSISEDDDTLVKAKKNNKMRLDSSHETSASKSLDDTQVKAKKKNKMRLDSSHETSASMSLNNSHNVQTEAKSLSKSIDSKSATNEVEMTICVENSNHEVDPLAIGIKKEPMTPKISSTNVSIQFVDPENSVENEGGKNKSHRNMTHIDDPLEDSNASNSSDSSDNIHIQNYDSVLNELNNSVKNKNKTANISLNLDTKTKQKATPIIDELNLTQIKTKTQKKNRNKDEVDSSKAGNKSSNEKSYSKNKPNNEENDNESSDSIDIHLLFSEDSNSSENQQINKKVNNEVETFIPLKKNPGKTNILEISGNKYTTETNKKKNELNKPGSEDEKADDDDVEIHFIMDTTGTHNSTELEKSFNVNTSLKKIEKSIKDDVDGSCLNASSVVSNKNYKETRRESKANEEIDKTVSSMHNKSITKTPKSEKKKKREKKMSDSLAMNEQDNNSDSDVPAEVCNKSLKETGKEKMNIENNETVSSMHNKSITKTPKSEKKKKRNSESLAQDEKDGNSDSDAPAEVPNKSFKEDEEGKIDAYEEINKMVSSMHNNSTLKTPKSEKKKKRISESSAIGVTDKPLNESVANTPASVKKKKKKLSESQSTEQMYGSDNSKPLEVNLNTSTATKPDKLHTDQNIEINEADESINKSLTKTPVSEKKKKKRLSESQSMTDAADEAVNKFMAKTPLSEKKKKKRLSESQSISLSISTSESPAVQESQNIESDAADEAINKSMAKTPLSEKKKKKRLSESQSINSSISTSESPAVQESQNVETDATDEAINKSMAKTPLSEKKKKKRLSESQSISLSTSTSKSPAVQDSQNIETDAADEAINKSMAKTPLSEKKKKKRLSESQSIHLNISTGESLAVQESRNIETENLETMSSKKRKRKSSHNQTDGEQGNGAQTAPITLPQPKISEVQNKRRKISHNTENPDQDQNISKDIPAVQKEQRRKNRKPKDLPHNSVNFEKGATETDNVDNNVTKETKKRKQREDDVEDKSAKVQKTNSLDKVNVPRLPTSILNELEENPKKKNLKVTKSKVISTSNFIVEEAKTVKNKPSNYLEESVYLNEDDVLESKKQKRIKNPRVLPFLPTVSTSNSGYTTSFKVNVIPKEFKFSAKSSNVSNFKNDFLENKKTKRIGTYELYKRNRNVKLSKF